MIVRTPGILMGLALCAAPQLVAQDSLLTELKHRLQSPAFTVGALLQVVGEYQNEQSGGQNGITIPNMRLRLSGELDGGFGYLLHTNFASAPAILDAEVHYRLTDGLVVQAGQFKAPFSRELLTGAGDLDFIERSRVVGALAPGRQLGIEARGRLAGRAVEYAVGGFNGNGTARSNDDDRLLGVARLAWWALGSEAGARRRLEFAANLGYSHDSNVRLGPLAAGFRGHRTVWGGDFRYTDGRWLVAAEVVGARLRFDSTGAVTHPHGWQATLGFNVTRKVQLLTRWDALRSDGLSADGDLLVLGLRAWPTGAIQFRLDDLIDTDHAALKHHRLLAGAQFGF